MKIISTVPYFLIYINSRQFHIDAARCIKYRLLLHNFLYNFACDTSYCYYQFEAHYRPSGAISTNMGNFNMKRVDGTEDNL